ncbi:MAG: ABC transporter ATP-binding protein [Peptococcaceae bacterium]|nr:ABC transporter ATP-binding protein [Peptococcaceae bacterium]
MLVLENFNVTLDGKHILHNINLTIKAGETHVLFGPNGHGKSTLLNAIMGLPRYRVSGRCCFKGQDITSLSVDERARLGIGLMFQRPPTIRGLSLRNILKICARNDIDIDTLASQLKLRTFLERDVNDGFSGGELKRSELLQLLTQQPDLALIDEPESGVDLENIGLIGSALNLLLEKEKPRYQGSDCQLKHSRHKAGLIITHTGHILNFVEADVGHVLYEGRLACTGHPREILAFIQQKGYSECVRCLV